jgi:osmotically-inducible protein OsmY
MADRNTEREDSTPTDYPLGRGYGHDYMRGGEVFGGYGYRDRENYRRTRGGDEMDESSAQVAETEVLRTGEHAARASAVTEAGPPTTDGSSPVPHLEHTYGDTGAAHRHSRSYYVTQAQLQQRFYGRQRSGAGPYQARLSTIERSDEELQRDVREALFFDTWVDADRIDIDVSEGTVTLRGALASAEEVRFACDDAWAVAGVREVRSELRVADGATG